MLSKSDKDRLGCQGKSGTNPLVNQFCIGNACEPGLAARATWFFSQLIHRKSGRFWYKWQKT